jgi:hypothetical protein
MLCLPYYCYVFYSTKLEIRVEQVLPGSEGWWWGFGRGQSGGEMGRNDPNNVCTCEEMNLKNEHV